MNNHHDQKGVSGEDGLGMPDLCLWPTATGSALCEVAYSGILLPVTMSDSCGQQRIRGVYNQSRLKMVGVGGVKPSDTLKGATGKGVR